MTTIKPVQPGEPRRDGRADGLTFLRRQWPLVGIGAAILLLLVWMFFREPEPDAVAATAAPAATDSIITLDSAAQKLAGIELLTVGTAGSGALAANGTITYDANRVSVITSRVDARVVSVRADLGQAVRAGAPLALLESQEVGQTRGDLERARATLDIAKRNYEREQRLFREQITPQKELLDAEATFRTAQADYRSATSRLRAVGAAGGQGATFNLASPVSGTVVERSVSPGQSVGSDDNLFTVADLRNVWITVDVYENDLARITSGAAVEIEPGSLPGETFTGRVTYAGGVVDTTSRTFKVRVEVANTALRLRPGMFAAVRIKAAAPLPNAVAGTITVPEIAVQEVDGKQVVFVAGNTPGRFIVRLVTPGARAGAGTISITGGLAAGERIVTRGAFQLKAELLKAGSGEEG